MFVAALSSSGSRSLALSFWFLQLAFIWRFSISTRFGSCREAETERGHQAPRARPLDEAPFCFDLLSSRTLCWPGSKRSKAARWIPSLESSCNWIWTCKPSEKSCSGKSTCQLPQFSFEQDGNGTFSTTRQFEELSGQTYPEELKSASAQKFVFESIYNWPWRWNNIQPIACSHFGLWESIKNLGQLRESWRCWTLPTTPTQQWSCANGGLQGRGHGRGKGRGNKGKRKDKLKGKSKKVKEPERWTERQTTSWPATLSTMSWIWTLVPWLPEWDDQPSDQQRCALPTTSSTSSTTTCPR